jgi:hypothetical protein
VSPSAGILELSRDAGLHHLDIRYLMIIIVLVEQKPTIGETLSQKFWMNWKSLLAL